MSMLVERLKREHGLLVDTLNKVKELGVGSREGQQKLLSAKIGLLAHLKAEDGQLYPALYQEAKNNEALRRTVEAFARDMETVSKDALHFLRSMRTEAPAWNLRRTLAACMRSSARESAKKKRACTPSTIS
ncbi:MAG: hypothetical protein M5R38_10415 [Candidatus Methylomirabilis sp.]|nr:hypothetical protein [Candidatus Methylomirabilis sp.]